MLIGDETQQPFVLECDSPVPGDWSGLGNSLLLRKIVVGILVVVFIAMADLDFFRERYNDYGHPCSRMQPSRLFG